VSTEQRDPRFLDLDIWPTATAIEAMLEGQLAAVAAVKSQTDALAAAADAAAVRLKAGGRLCYAGAGTSGRIAVQDGVELTPTFDWPGERMVFLLAGGTDAMASSAEGAEDDRDAGQRDGAALGPNDVLIGVAASGRTPYTIAAIEAARGGGALTIGVANNAGTPVLTASEHAILLDTGPEIVAGSTRMKAGTAQKVVLNLLSTAIMLRLARVHRGLMINMRVSNDKLARRAAGMVREIAGVSDDAAAAALAQAGGSIPRAILIARGASAAEARARLAAHGGNLRAALECDDAG
jgi:N-acetylmuramic acid 6-phosphate etherase